ncbi:hypothetical protein [Agrobacterium tumefaciens]|uniref:hypothetical protein n=1 Tax=Agrobacterium tumefaciens TaxID=358 RepID=UPI00054FF976|nr:hypothetical protein [Agrobacterium tumefaciens]
MTALEELKKAFPNMFRPLKWHHFDGPTEHGCGEWYAHATRGMYHIYDVREKFPNDRPFYAKELSDQFDTLEQAQDAVQNRHELDIVMCLDPDFRSTLESLQRENEELRNGPPITGKWKDDERAKVWEYAFNKQHTRAEAAEAKVKRYREALIAAKTRMRNCRGAIESDQVFDKDVHGSLQNGIRDIQEALASTGGEHHAE